MSFVRIRTLLCAALVSTASTIAEAQLATPQAHQHSMPVKTPEEPRWTLMNDGVLFGLFNHQGGPRGGDEARALNWWMGMAARTAGRSTLTLTGMLSLDPVTVGKRGYGEIFQAGEAVDGRPLIDRQHPHDLFMQLAAVWRLTLSDTTAMTIAGAPAGEPALGPVAFMHRASAAENPFAPLSHHTFDSTHIAYGVMTAALDRGPFVFEGSVFNGREPDENRWDLDFGRMDSLSARVWYKPSDRWEFQLSSGHLVEPEEVVHGNVDRTTASGSWFKRDGQDFVAIAGGYGVNRAHDTSRQAVFAEATRRAARTTIFGRAEIVQVETDLLVTGDAVPHGGAGPRDAVGAFTLGAVRDVGSWRGFEAGVGAEATVYAVPDALKTSHGDSPVSFQLFLRLRPPVGSMGRMWNMRMTQPMSAHRMSAQ